MRRINQDVREFCARDPRTPTATIRSWEEAGWKPTSAGELNISQNPSEAEAMGPDLDEEEVLNTAVNEGGDFQPAMSAANLSLVSGIELLAVSREGEEDSPEFPSTLEEGSGQGASAAPPQVAAAMGNIIVPGGEEDDGEEWGTAYLLNDSIDLYMVSRPSGEAYIVNVSGEDSVLSSSMEEVPTTPTDVGQGASSEHGKREEEAYVSGFNLKRFK